MLKKKYTWFESSNSHLSLRLSSAVFLASPEASYISGEILAVTGGLSYPFHVDNLKPGLPLVVDCRFIHNVHGVG